MDYSKIMFAENQINKNLRRTARKGLISLLNYEHLNVMSDKYFGIRNEDGNIVSWRCPYSGKIINSKSDLVLEHIIPVSSGGGTILFNCVPAHVDINGPTEKGAKHLLSWWINSDYWDNDAPLRLSNLVNYMLEAYEIIFTNYTILDIEESYQTVDKQFYDEEEYDVKNDLITEVENDYLELKEQSLQTGLISYYQFLNDCICELKDCNIDTSSYEARMDKLVLNGVFKDADRYVIFQEVLRTLIAEKLDEDDRSELTILISMDVKKIMDSMARYSNRDEIANELSKRIDNLEDLLERKDIGIISYFEDVKNMNNGSLLAKRIDEIDSVDILFIVEKINLSVKDKFNKLVSYILAADNNEYSLSSMTKDMDMPKVLTDFVKRIKNVYEKNGNRYFNVKLKRNQLEFLHNSTNEKLRRIYIEILEKSIINDVEIEYVDFELKERIENYYNEVNMLKINNQYTLENQIHLEKNIVMLLDQKVNLVS